jgi:hypothetical protein
MKYAAVMPHPASALSKRSGRAAMPGENIGVLYQTAYGQKAYLAMKNGAAYVASA